MTLHEADLDPADASAWGGSGKSRQSDRAPETEIDPAVIDALSVHTWSQLDIKPEVRLLGEMITSTTRMFLVGATGLGKTMFVMGMVGGMITGKGFLNWTCDRPSKWLIIDGEMPSSLIKSRAVDMLRRAGANKVPPDGLTIYSRDRAELFAKQFPDLGNMPPINEEGGHNFILALIAKLGGVDGVVFDNLMSLAPGDQKDEEAFAGCIPLVESLTRMGIAQIWIDHTGHNTTRQYGSSAKAWRMDGVGVMRPVGEDVLVEPGELAFLFGYDHPGKARRRTPDNWQDFATQIVRLVDDEWFSQPAESAKARPSEPKLADKPAVALDMIQKLVKTTGTLKVPEPDEPAAMCVTREATRAALIKAGCFPEHLLLDAFEPQKLNRAGSTAENNMLTSLKRRNIIGFNRNTVWMM